MLVNIYYLNGEFFEMKNNDTEFKFRNVNRICNFYAGDAHFCTTALTYLTDKVDKGARLILFVNGELRDRLNGLISKVSSSFDLNRWQMNTVIYPLESIIKIKNEEYFCRHLKSMMELMSLNCSEEGLIICVQRTNDIRDEYINKIEEMTTDLPVTVNLVNCYEFTIDKQLILKVLSNNKFIINTSGISEIGEVYSEIAFRILA